LPWGFCWSWRSWPPPVRPGNRANTPKTRAPSTGEPPGDPNQRAGRSCVASADALDSPDPDRGGGGHYRGRAEQGGVAGERDERGGDGRADGVRGHDGDVDDAEVLGPVVGLRQHLGDQRLVDGDVAAEADAEERRRGQC